MRIVKEHINEGYLDDIRYEDAVTPRYINIQMQSSYNEDYLIGMYRYENYIDKNISDNEILYSPEFNSWLRYTLEYRFDEIFLKLKSSIKEDGTIDIWRRMLVNQDWIDSFPKNGKHIGRYWSFDKSAAEPHHGYGAGKELNVLIKSNIKEEYVNWLETIRLNMEFSSEEEKEIRLFKNTPLKIEEFYVNDVKLYKPEFKNKYYLS